MKPSIQTILHRVGLAFLLLTLSQNVALAGPFNVIVVFGDSLSDNGNLLLIPDQPKPDPTLYYQGRLSNGPVWVEYLADAQHLNVSLTDRALGGAMSDSLIPPGLIEQVPAYITAEGSPLSAKALFIVWIGGNDYLHGDGDSQATVNNIKDALEQLAQAKAMNILYRNKIQLD
jgi:phospholipase/lecithinase/hemolysin